MHRFGASAPLKDLLKFFRFTVDVVVEEAHRRWQRSKRESSSFARTDSQGVVPTRSRLCPNDLRRSHSCNPLEFWKTAKTTNPLKALLSYGQSMWLDYIRRDLITSGSLKKMIDEDGLRGMTSNPAIFEKAIADSSLYDDMLKTLASRNDLDTTGRYEQIAIRDIQDAADVLRPVYDSSKFRDGYVSLEVSPLLARKIRETIDEARRLWKAVKSRERDDQDSWDAGTSRHSAGDRRGYQRQCDLLFAQEVYEKVAEAHIAA